MESGGGIFSSVDEKLAVRTGRREGVSGLASVGKVEANP
jgi:hypothetical protein